MSWITIVWSMNAAACLTLAAIYLLVWCKQRQDPAHLLFSVTAVAAAAIAAFELEMMHAETVGQYEALMRWIHVPVWVLVISFVSFVRLYLHAGRRWLAWSICGAMLGELSGSIAHELNLPLSAILCNAQAAQRILANGKVDHTELREILNEVISEDKRACEVIRRLRLWLKKGEVQQHSLRINNVVQDVLRLLRSDLIHQKVIVDCELARNLPGIIGDPVQLQQVLVNLVVNACDAITNRTIPERRLLIRTGIQNRNGSSAVTVSVTDRGGSIPEEKMEQIFEPFFTTKPKGMGLGLSVCRTIIAAHRGKLWATNNADCGATFHFSLPIAAPDKGAPIIDTNHLTNMQCCSHGAVRHRGGVAPRGVKAPRGSGYDVTKD